MVRHCVEIAAPLAPVTWSPCYTFSYVCGVNLLEVARQKMFGSLPRVSVLSF